MVRKNINEVNPRVTPRIRGIVFVIPKLNPEYDATTLLGPGEQLVTNINRESDRISGCIIMLLADRFQIFVKDVLILLFPLYLLNLKLVLVIKLQQYFFQENYKHL